MSTLFISVIFNCPYISEPYDYYSWILILIFSVHATGASIFIFEWISPSGLDQGKTSSVGKTISTHLQLFLPYNFGYSDCVIYSHTSVCSSFKQKFVLRMIEHPNLNAVKHSEKKPQQYMI